MLQYLLARAKEPSSYAGIAMLLTAAGIHLSDIQFNAIVNVLVAVAGAVAIFVPEAAAQGGVKLLAIIVGSGLLVLTGCQNGQPITAAQLQTDIQTVQPLASALACDAQNVANLTTASLTAAGDATGANKSSVTSAVAGIWCNGLAQGAVLPMPVPIAGTASVPTSSGATVTVPVPVAVPAAPAS
ncbi:MAG TPA: hypothetical protein VLX09_02155 [Stellaceae bacterium]|nr:hypothetical protein [Stellaceae bacterium]